ncbi:hypothetical protein DRO91_03305 [Candidatus Heimdallarchaeota archaeon]|nr:MAG: hypothetical protein DRO63_07610 [Candidatus Gerdarchaeota archaeon]RLI70826.1 MAG: hypothetical protein DRP02_06640 [Candidatus Gerdarchaeota archaeon]RLI73264.1 MAG: hypothetical protein DRO91_03305 [Candidatus Heimdallarchaeota archaeon]
MDEIKNHYVQLGIATRIPLAFKRFCDEKFQLKEVPPVDIDKISRDEEKIRTIFEIIDKEGTKVAIFKPSGEYQCLSDDFKPLFEQIVEELNYAAYKAAKAQDELAERDSKNFGNKLC